MKSEVLMVAPSVLYADLVALAASLGAFRLAVADLAALGELSTQPPDLLGHYRRGISMAVRLDDAIVDGLLPPHNPRPGVPTPDYARLYEWANRRLDEMAAHVVRYLEGRLYRAEAIPASKTLQDQQGALPHKAVARQAGLGWIGRHLLLIVPGAGPRVRLATVLTDALLPAGRPADGDCGDCRRCLEACPVDALRFTPYEAYPERAAALDVAACAARLASFRHDPAVGQPVCGICMAVCPAGRDGQ
jgi:epoxyqueuosine reductase QueG